MKITFTGPYSLFRPTGPFAGLIQEARWRGAAANVVKNGNNGELVITFQSLAEFTITQLLQIVGAGAEVEGYPIFIKMDDATYQSQVPSYLPNRTYLDDNDVEQVRTWQEWHDSTHQHMTAGDGEHIVPGNSFGAELQGSVIGQLNTDGYALLNSITVKDELPDEQV